MFRPALLAGYFNKDGGTLRGGEINTRAYSSYYEFEIKSAIIRNAGGTDTDTSVTRETVW